jgi:iron complex outermembrane receptor protein
MGSIYSWIKSSINRQLNCQLPAVLLAAGMLLLIQSGPVAAEMTAAQSRVDLTAFNIEELMDITVTSVSKKSQKISNAAAAIYVISQDDIRRSGVTTIADALRMVPGVQVAQIDSNKWAVTSRGFNGRFANKLLVLMDGRSLYTPFFIGVYWEVQDTVLEDIERIEVIRGPGAALWGANAVNGVINIITKSADKTQGALVSTGGGTSETAFATARYGAAIGESSNIRLYAKHHEREGFVDASGKDTNDSWHTTQGGFRFDSQLTLQDTLTVQGDYYAGKLNETYTLYKLPAESAPPYKYDVQNGTGISGGNVLARWQRSLSDSDNISLQLYYDHTERDMLVSPQKFNTIDLDMQHRFSLGHYQDIVWGLGYRFSQYEVHNTNTLSFDQQRVSNNLYSAFLHNEITLVPSTLFLMVGSRFEHNDYSGFDVQPNGRLLWTITPRNSLWGAVSRAVRSSTRGEQDIHYNYRSISPSTPEKPTINQLGIPLRLEIVGNRQFKSEELIAYEIGYRTEPLPRLSFDIAAYYNSYKKLRILIPGTPYTENISGSPNAVQPYILSNDMHGHAVGVEFSAEWTPYDWWRLQSSYSYQNLTMFLDGKSEDSINKRNAEADVPQHQFSVRSGFDLGRQVSLDLWLRGTDRLDSIDGQSIRGYITMDARLAWKPAKGLELALVGRNLFESHHAEFIPEYINTLPSEVERSFYGKLTWQF